MSNVLGTKVNPIPKEAINNKNIEPQTESSVSQSSSKESLSITNKLQNHNYSINTNINTASKSPNEIRTKNNLTPVPIHNNNIQSISTNNKATFTEAPKKSNQRDPKNKNPTEPGKEKRDLSHKLEERLQKLEPEIQTRKALQKAFVISRCFFSFLFLAGVVLLSTVAPFSLVAIIGSSIALAVLCGGLHAFCKAATRIHLVGLSSKGLFEPAETFCAPSSFLRLKRMALGFFLNRNNDSKNPDFEKESIIKFLEKEGKISESWRKHRWKVRFFLGFGFVGASVATFLFPPLAIFTAILGVALIGSFLLPRQVLFYKTGYSSFNEHSEDIETFLRSVDPSRNEKYENDPRIKSYCEVGVTFQKNGECKFTLNKIEASSQEASISPTNDDPYPYMRLRKQVEVWRVVP